MTLERTLSIIKPDAVKRNLIGAILTLLGNLIADISYALADPRIRQQ